MMWSALGIVLAGASASVSAEDYPAAAVWEQSREFCAGKDAVAGWVQFEPEPDTVLDFLRRPSPVASDDDSPNTVVHSSVVEGRKLYAMKREFPDQATHSVYRQCLVFDFEMQDKLDVDQWSGIIGLPVEVDDRFFRQRLNWRLDADGRQGGRIEVRQQGWGPGTDQVGYLGTTFIFVSREIL
jgi:hypothetical protein